jgi:death-on-curing protein
VVIARRSPEGRASRRPYRPGRGRTGGLRYGSPYIVGVPRTIELPDDLAAALKEVAAAEHRSVPATVAFGVEAYEDVWTKAGALLQSIAMNHGLIDGNKRLAWVAARVFLDLNEVPPTVVDVDRAEALVIQVVTHELGAVEEVAKGLIALYAGSD